MVYTPPAVAGPMVRLALEGFVRGKTATEILAIRVCDPAIGAGAFLVEVVSVLAEHVIAAWRAGDSTAPGDRACWPAEARQRIAQRCISGVDIDARAVEAAAAATGAGPGSLLVADAIGLDWARAFPEVFARGGFDVVVGNPPYIRQERITAHKAAFRKFASYDGVADLYVYFIELTHQLVRPGGHYCLIVPNKWLTAAYGRPLRTYLAAQASVEGIVDLSRAPLFEGAEAFPCIVWGRVSGSVASSIQASRPDGDTAVSAALEGTGVAHARDRWGANPWHIDRASDRTLIDRLDRAWPTLGEVVRDKPSRGVVTGCNRAFVIDRATRDRIVDSEPAAAALIRPFVKGRDVRSWLPGAAERWIVLVDRGTSLDALPVTRAHLAQYREALEPRPAGFTGAWHGRKPGSYAWYELQDPVVPLARSHAPRLLYQDIQTGPACCLDRGGDLIPDTTVWILPSEDRFLLAVLNSPLYGWYARRRFPPALNGAVRPKLEYLRAFPVATPTDDARDEITTRVAQRLVLEASVRTAGTTAAAAREARILDDALFAMVADVYGLSAAERGLLSE